MGNGRRQRRDRQQNRSVFTDKVYLTDGKNPALQLPSFQYGDGDPKVHEELAKDRHWILSQNYQQIRRIATRVPQESIVFSIVDCQEALGATLGSVEAAQHYQQWRSSRGEFALAWVTIHWADGDKALSSSRDWPRFKELIEGLGLDQVIPTVVLSGKDLHHGLHKGSHLGYTFAAVRREGAMAPEGLDELSV